MTPWLLPSLVGVISALIASAGGYLVASRTTSGRIETSEAASLWAESNAMRQELRAEVLALRTQAAESRQREDQLQRQVDDLRGEVATLKARLGITDG